MMDFAAFIQECREDIDRFEAHWQHMHKQQPTQYPTQMHPGDWYDQFLTFLSLSGKDIPQ